MDHTGLKTVFTGKWAFHKKLQIIYDKLLKKYQKKTCRLYIDSLVLKYKMQLNSITLARQHLLTRVEWVAEGSFGQSDLLIF